MNRKTQRILVLFCLLAMHPASASEALDGVEIALSFDDLPWVGAPPVDGSETDAINRIAAVLNAHDAPAIGFVVCDRYDELQDPVTAWNAWGLSIGNHGSSHLDLNRTSTTAWLEDVRNCHEQLERLSNYRGHFRFPMLHRGDTRSKRDAVAAALAEMDQNIAHVSIDTSDWILTRYHAAAVKSGNARLRRAVGEVFLEHVLDAIRHAVAVSNRKLGRSIPLVLLLHANSIADDYLDELLLAIRGEGARFVAIDEALADPAYRRDDDYVGSKGLSWLYRMHPASPEDADWDDDQAAQIRNTLDPMFALGNNKLRRTTVSSLPVGDRKNEALMALLERAGQSERWRSLIIYQRDVIELEAYFNGVNETTPQNVKSITKSLLSLLFGVALERGWIDSVTDAVDRHLASYSSVLPDPEIRFRELLTMSTGLIPVPYNEIQQQEDWIRSILESGVAAETRGAFHYDTPVLQLLSASVGTAARNSLVELANHDLLRGTGATIAYWRQDPRGHRFGGNDAYLTPRAMLELGKLVLGKGMRNGRRIVAGSFLDDATRVQIVPGSETVNHDTLPVRGYGYLWWLTEIGGENAIAALGHGGQMIFVVPSKASVVVVTSRWPMQSSVAHYDHVTSMLNGDFLPMFWNH